MTKDDEMVRAYRAQGAAQLRVLRGVVPREDPHRLLTPRRRSRRRLIF